MRLFATLAWATTLAVLAAPHDARAADPTRRPPEITLHAPDAWSPDTYRPVDIAVRAHQPERLHFALHGLSGRRYYGSNRPSIDFQLQRTVSLPAGASARLEFPFIGSGRLDVTDASGQSVPLTSSPVFHLGSSGYHGGNERPFFLVNGFQLAEVNDARNKITTAPGYAAWNAHTAVPHTLDRERLPRQWFAYAGLTGPLLFAADDLRQLDRERADALARAVQYLGARVIVVGPDGPRAVRDAFGFDPQPRLAGAVDAPEGKRVAWMGGAFYFPTPFNAPDWADGQRLGRVGSGGFARYDATPSDGQRWMFALLPGLSTFSVVLLLVLLGVLLGPVNYWFVRKHDRLLLFFVSTPVLAAVGAFMVFLASVFAEGITTKYAESAVLLQRAGSSDAMMVHHRLIHSGLFTPRLVYPEDTLTLPFRDGAPTLHLAVDDTDHRRLTGDWITPRTPSGLTAMYPVALRLGVEIVEENGQLFAVNQLTHPIRRLAARGADGTVRTVEDLAPGARLPLRTSSDALRVLRDLAERARREGGHAVSEINTEVVVLAAECAGLPYLEDGRLGGRLIEGRYFHLVAE